MQAIFSPDSVGFASEYASILTCLGSVCTSTEQMVLWAQTKCIRWKIGFFLGLKDV